MSDLIPTENNYVWDFAFHIYLYGYGTDGSCRRRKVLAKDVNEAEKKAYDDIKRLYQRTHPAAIIHKCADIDIFRINCLGKYEEE